MKLQSSNYVASEGKLLLPHSYESSAFAWWQTRIFARNAGC